MFDAHKGLGGKSGYFSRRIAGSNAAGNARLECFALFHEEQRNSSQFVSTIHLIRGVARSAGRGANRDAKSLKLASCDMYHMEPLERVLAAFGQSSGGNVGGETAKSLRSTRPCLPCVSRYARSARRKSRLSPRVIEGLE